MALFDKNGSKTGLSSKDSEIIAQHLHKAHGVIERVFHHIHDTLIVIDEIGVEDAQKEVESLRRYAKHLDKIRHIIQNNRVAKPKEALKLQDEELSLEGNLVSLLARAKVLVTNPDNKKAEELLTNIKNLIDELETVIPQEEQYLAAA